jgi:transposase
MNARVEADSSLMRRRQCTAEQPFGTIKRMTAGGRFLTRGLGLAAAQGDLWFVTVFGAASVVTIIEVVRRLL